MKKLGFIGAGHIAEILINNFTRTGAARASDIAIFDPNKDRVSELVRLFGVKDCNSNNSLISDSDVIFICVHPDVVFEILKDISRESVRGKVIISVSAGVSVLTYRKNLPEAKIIRILPNPPSKMAEGVVAITLDKTLSDDDCEYVCVLLKTLGHCFFVDEDKIDIFTSITSPAPIMAFFEAIVESAVLLGLDYKSASNIVFQTVKGCLMMWESGRDINKLIVESCTPAGTSVESLRVMDKNAFRSTIKEAYYAAWQKTKAM